MSKPKKPTEQAVRYTVSKETAEWVEYYKLAESLFDMLRAKICDIYGAKNAAFSEDNPNEGGRGGDVLNPVNTLLVALAERVKESVDANLACSETEI